MIAEAGTNGGSIAKMSWRDDDNLPSRWHAFGEALVAARPEWEPFVLGAVAAYNPRYGEDDVRFIVEIPSVHPTISAPLVAEIADPEYQGHIDVYWGEFFEHVIGSGLPRDEHFAKAIDLMTGMVDERWLFLQRRDEAGRRTHRGRVPAPLNRSLHDMGSERGGSLVARSWRGTYDEDWPLESE